MIWRFIVTSILCAVVMIVQGIQINLDVLVEYQIKNRVRTNWTFDFLSPALFRIDTERQARYLSNTERLVMLHVTYFSSYFVSSVFFSWNMCYRRIQFWAVMIMVALLAIFTVTAPWSVARNWSVYLDRGFLGFASGTIYPIIHDYLALWTIPEDRGFVCSIVYGGMPLGVMMTILFIYVFTEIDCGSLFFYVCAVLVAIVTCLMFLVRPLPGLHPFVSDDEKDYIRESLEERADQSLNRRNLPTQTLYKSMVLWTIVFASFNFFWGWYVVVFVIPLYMQFILEYKVFDNVLMITLPFVGMFVFGVALSIVLDTLVVKSVMSTTTARKVAILTSAVVPLTCFSILIVIKHSGVGICLLMLAVTTMSGRFYGSFANIMDVAPNYAGVLTSFAFWTVAPISLFVLFLSQVLMDYKSKTLYDVIFAVTSGLYAIEAVVSFFYLSAKEADWNWID